jgi:hypothetical protein
MEALGELRPMKVTDADGLAALAREIKADLVVVGPETALEAGLADLLAAAGIPCFGPTAKAAQLETSKAFSKAFMQRHDIPTAGFGVYERLHEARQALGVFKPPYVIKADGLAAGKGVAISPDRKDAEAELARMLGGRFGKAGARVVIEEFMEGEEGSLFALCDGRRAVLFGGAQDHKRAFDGDRGPNTGGMGAYAPAPVMTPPPRLREAEVIALVERSIGLFERLGGLDQRDELLFKDIVRSNVLTASSGMLPAIPRDDELTLSDAWLEVFQEVLPRTKYRSAGTLVASAYREDFGQEPPCRQQFVDGAPRQVKSYQRSWLVGTLKRFKAQLAGG